MDESSSTASTARKLSYFNLLQELDKLSKLLNELNNCITDSELDIIFNNLTENIDRVCGEMDARRSAMFLITIFNTLLRVGTIYKSGYIISRTSFQALVQELTDLISNISFKIFYSSYVDELLDSMLMNLAKDSLAEKCFKRLLSNDTSSLIDLTTTAEARSQDDKTNFVNLVYMCISYANSFVEQEFGLPANEFKKNYKSLLRSFLMFVDSFLTNTNEQTCLTVLALVTAVLSLMWNLTDKVSLIPIFTDLGYVEKTIQWIRTDMFALRIGRVGQPIFAIIHNLSRDKTGLNQFRQMNAFNILMERKQLVDNENNRSLKEEFGIALLALSTNDEPPEESKTLILETTRTLYGRCQNTGRTSDLRCGGFHLSEILELLHRAFANAYVIKDILDSDKHEKPTPIQFFADLLLSIYGVLVDRESIPLEKCAAEYLLKILFQISNYKEYREELIKNNEFCVVIQGLANRPKQGDAKRIAKNLRLSVLSQEPKKEMSSMIYISYDSVDQEFCERFVNELYKRTTIPIWVAYEQVEPSDDMWEYTSSVIKSAHAVIALVSTAYGESTDKFQELSYIVSTNKLLDNTRDLIVVKAEPHFHFNRSWMKELLHDKIPISYEQNINNMVLKVCDQIDTSKKSSNKCTSCKFKHQQKTTTTSSNMPAADFNLPRLDTHVRNESTKTSTVSNIVRISDSSAVSTTRQQRPFSIVSSLFTQTGSTDSSTWV